jgi:hypothetical protein
VSQIIGGTAAKVYGFDVEKLGKIASEIGPERSSFGS